MDYERLEEQEKDRKRKLMVGQLVAYVTIDDIYGKETRIYRDNFDFVGEVRTNVMGKCISQVYMVVIREIIDDKAVIQYGPASTNKYVVDLNELYPIENRRHFMNNKIMGEKMKEPLVKRKLKP